MEIRPIISRPELKQKGPIVVVNPRITNYSEKIVSGWEGCLSLPGIYAKVPRSKSITVEYWNEKGIKITEQATDLWARVFQHEIDHLHGLSFMDRVKDMKSIVTYSEFVKLNKKKNK